MAAKAQWRGPNGVAESSASVEREGELGKTPPMRLCGVKGPHRMAGKLPGKAALARRAERERATQHRINEAQETISAAEATRRMDWIEWAISKDTQHCEDEARKAELGKLLEGYSVWRDTEGKPWEGR